MLHPTLSRANGKIRNLQPGHAVHVQALVQDAVLDDAVALLGGHAAGAERVPCRLHVPLHPLLHGLEVFLGVVEVLVQRLGVAVEPVDAVGFGWGEGDGPGSCWVGGLVSCLIAEVWGFFEVWGGPTVLDAGADVVRSSVGVGGGEVHVCGSSWGVCQVGQSTVFLWDLGSFIMAYRNRRMDACWSPRQRMTPYGGQSHGT